MGKKKTDNITASKKKATHKPISKKSDLLSSGIVSPEPKKVFPIVGIGASAGGLSAFESFFSGMPADRNHEMAFVLVQHLAPDHKSILTDLVKQYTSMQVFEVEDGMTVQPNCTYIIPPGFDMALMNGNLQLLEPAAPHGQRLPIDFFFRSLAQDQKELAICIILSGTGSDGSLGVRAVKGEGGMVMVQDSESAEYDGMPRSASATGMVDYELPPDEMPKQIISYLSHSLDKSNKQTLSYEVKSSREMKKLFLLLRTHTGHDFSQYKPNTINRRIQRRMAVTEINSIEEYVKYAHKSQTEIDALFRDLLIGVTNFFRDREVFEYIEMKIIPGIFESKQSNEALRVWIPGCSTGEEAYSLAILMAEYMDVHKKPMTVQVFATDIDSAAISTARAGLYPESIASDIPPEKLKRYFTLEPGGNMYRISKFIRDMLIFSEQDIIKDPPFSKLDLISCRNLLIYLGPELQKKLIPLFYYALNPGGFLILGTSESVGDYESWFTKQDRKQKIYRRKEDFSNPQRITVSRFIPPLPSLPSPVKIKQDKKMLPLKELTEQELIRHIVTAAILVNSAGDILYLHGRTGLFLEPSPGVPGILNVIKMAREGLRRDLATTLHKVVNSCKALTLRGLRVKTNGDYSITDLTIRPVEIKDSANRNEFLYLIILELSAQKTAKQEGMSQDEMPEAQKTIASLQNELQANQEYLQSTQEELETMNEELKSSNEEMQSVNEELQSSNEELETSKEELQSVNEELSTVNTELQSKVSELSRSNNDMNNLLAGTGIGTVFVDFQLQILRFTPAVTKIINLIQSDVGRPVSHIISNLKDYDNLIPDIQSVLDTLVLKEFEVETRSGSWYRLCIQPYRTLENVIEGAVISFVDISKSKEIEDKLHISETRFQRFFAATPVAMNVYTLEDNNLRLLQFNPASVKLTGSPEIFQLGKSFEEIFPGFRNTEIVEILRSIARGKDDTLVIETLYKDDRIEGWYELTIFNMSDNTIGLEILNITKRKKDHT